VPGSTLRYGSHFTTLTEYPAFLSKVPIDAVRTPLPIEEQTPPVMMINLVFSLETLRSKLSVFFVSIRPFPLLARRFSRVKWREHGHSINEVRVYVQNLHFLLEKNEGKGRMENIFQRNRPGLFWPVFFFAGLAP